VVAAALIAIAALGCGDAGAAPADGGARADAAGAGGPVAPALPAAPRLTPCPAGWHEVTSDGVVLCDPWPAGGAIDCGPGQAHFPGEPGCERVGTVCPATGDFPEGLPTDRPVFYVRAGAAAGGDGSQATPFARIRDGVAAAAGMNGIVAIGRGRYDETVALRVGVTLWGACTADTVLSSSVTGGTTGVVSASLPGASAVKNLTIGPSVREGITAAAAGAEITVEDVVVDRATGVGVNVYRGGRVLARSLVIRDTVFGTTPPTARAVGIQEGGHAELRRVAFERNYELGVYVSGDGSTVVLEDAAIRGGGGPDGARSIGGSAIFLRAGTSAEVRRAVLEGNAEVGAYVEGALTAEDLIVRDTRGVASSGALGDGISVSAGGSASVTRALVDRNRNLGVQVVEAGSSLVLQDVVIRDTQAQLADGEWGRGVEASRAATLEATRVLVLRNRELGVHVSGSQARLSDLEVRDTQTRADGTAGRGLNFQGAQLTLARVASVRNSEVGLALIGTSATLAATDLSISGTPGSGLALQTGASAEIDRIHIDSGQGLAILASDGASARVTDVVLADTRESPCAGGCTSAGGHAVAAVRGAMVTLARFEITGAAVCGVLIADDGALDMSEGVVRGCGIGACLQVEGFDASRISRGVQFVSNTSNLQATTLPVPESIAPIGP